MFRPILLLRLRFALYRMRHDSAKHLNLGVAYPLGAITPKFEFGRNLCAMHLPHKFHHPTFNH